jgi:energy-coupling factor transporter ATP-binding protein EcfA2
MNTDVTDLPHWFSQRPKWLQDAARRLFQAGQLTADDLKELHILCKREVGISVDACPTIAPLPLTAAAFNFTKTSGSLRLHAIADVKGINALSPRRPLELGKESLTVIYGSNGSGKSGYIRVLKHICGGRGTKTLHHNVFASKSEEQSCTVQYTLGADIREFAWTPGCPAHAELRHVALYDNDCAHVYVNDENEVAYEPILLGHFRRLVEACEAIDKLLTAEIATKVSTKPLLPTAYATTVAGTWFTKLSHSPAATEIDQHCSWTEEQERELGTLNQRLSEQNPVARAQALRKTKEHLVELRTLLTGLGAQLDDDALLRLRTCREIARTKRQAADIDAKKVFERAPLAGVAAESWRLLWEKARDYSEREAFKGVPFPFIGDDARCVLCQQSLDADARIRMTEFETYVTGMLEAEATEAEKALTLLLDSLQEVSSADAFDKQCDLAGITEPDVRTSLQTYCGHLRARRFEFRAAGPLVELLPMPVADVLAELERRESECGIAAAGFDEDAKADRKKELQEKVCELAARKWLAQQKNAVSSEIARLKEIKLLEQAKRHANTTALSTKKNALADTLITIAFVKRFEDELKALGASHLQVTIRKTRTTKAQVWHQITLQNTKIAVKTAEVLSEGELRVVSLAAFLADVATNGHCTPFIFDDPISSLDLDFEAATAARLTDLSKTRQLIVFTHRLSLLFMLQEAAKKIHAAVTVISLERQSWGTGEPCEPPLPAQQPAKALNTLYGQRLAQARRAWQVEGTSAYSVYAKALCSDIRITLERLIENDLLADVVQRFRRNIYTLKLDKLANIRPEDCALLDGMMTKYSCFEHSQPNEAPVPFPPPDELANDLDVLIKWHRQFSNRPTSHTNIGNDQAAGPTRATPQPRTTTLLPPGSVPTLQPSD